MVKSKSEILKNRVLLNLYVLDTILYLFLMLTSLLSLVFITGSIVGNSVWKLFVGLCIGFVTFLIALLINKTEKIIKDVKNIYSVRWKNENNKKV